MSGPGPELQKRKLRLMRQVFTAAKCARVTDEELADRLGVHVVTMRDWRKDKHSPRTQVTQLQKVLEELTEKAATNGSVSGDGFTVQVKLDGLLRGMTPAQLAELQGKVAHELSKRAGAAQ